CGFIFGARRLPPMPTKTPVGVQRTLEEATGTRFTPAPWVIVARRLGSPLPALDETVGGQADQRQYEPTRRRADQRGGHRSTSTAIQPGLWRVRVRGCCIDRLDVRRLRQVVWVGT